MKVYKVEFVRHSKKVSVIETRDGISGGTSVKNIVLVGSDMTTEDLVRWYKASREEQPYNIKLVKVVELGEIDSYLYKDSVDVIHNVPCGFFNSTIIPDGIEKFESISS